MENPPETRTRGKVRLATLCSLSGMVVPCVLLLTVLGAEVPSKSADSSESEAECCIDTMEVNSTCLANSQCTPGCYRRWNADGSSSCVKCENETLPAALVYNLTDCQNGAAREGNPLTNVTATTPVALNVGGPEVAASLIFGTFLISLFLILCVASFFYLKRANKLPNLFYRRSKGSIVQSAESASMLSPPSSIRKPRYVRRERSLVTSGTSTILSAETRVSNV